ncbi:MAG: septum formation initiator family protein [Geminicoccaceae bacterium]|nr:septum formation initiator family protein [Geminicoccaceae bacterium]
MGSEFSKSLGRHSATAVLVLVLAYFGYHAIHGERGLLAWIDQSRLVEIRRHELAGLEARRDDLQRRVGGLKENHVSPDLLEEELKKLGYVGHNEAIILVPEQPDGK